MCFFSSACVSVHVCVFVAYFLWPVSAVAFPLPAASFCKILCSRNKNPQRQNKQRSLLMPHITLHAHFKGNKRKTVQAKHCATVMNHCYMDVCCAVCELREENATLVKEWWLNYLNGCWRDYWGQWASISFNATSLECAAKEERSRDLNIKTTDKW